MIDELVNDYCILGDDGAVIFASYDHVLEFVDKIRADEREACAVVCEELVLAYVGNASATANQCAQAIRARSNHD